MNAIPRFHGLILNAPGLNSSTAAGIPPVAGERDRTMNRPHPRRRGTAGRPGRHRRPATGIVRLTEVLPVNPQLDPADVRLELVARVRQEILAGTYDTPDKLEAALDRLAGRLRSD